MFRLVFLSMVIGVIYSSSICSQQSHTPQELICLHDKINCSEEKSITEGLLPNYQDDKWDACCSRVFLEKYAPHGFVVVFGRERHAKSGQPEYELIRAFSKKWTDQNKARDWPIATGGGPGLMEAANRGAAEAREGKGLTLALHTCFTKPCSLAKANKYLTREHYFIYRNYSKRESDLIDHAQAVIVGPGGFGTEWEIMETLSKLESRKKNAIPVIFLASPEKWETLVRRMASFSQRETITKDMCNYMFLTDSPDKAVQLILMDKDQRLRDSSSLCSSNTWIKYAITPTSLVG